MAASDQRDGQQKAPEPGHEAPEYTARVRRILTGHPPRFGPGPRTAPRWARRQAKATVSAVAAPSAGSGPASGAPAAPAAGALTEWHEMTPGQQAATWADLRAWVTWLTDRYELTIEDKLPRCWAHHPGLVEELQALRTWRKEIYGSGLRPAGQAARYWHAELERVVHAATSRYAVGCRAGHRGATHPVAEDRKLQDAWAAASPLAGVPEADLDATAARSLGGWAPAQEMAAALDAGEAAMLPGPRDRVLYRGTWWLPASGGWYQDPSRSGEEPDGGTGP